MYQVSLFRGVHACVVGLGAAAMVALLPSAPVAAAEAPVAVSPVRVDAGYKITLNGFDLGTFSFKSNVGRTQYTLDTDVQISALLGVFQWKGVTRSSGSLAEKSPQPENFRFDYESSLRSGSVSMGFDKGEIERISVVPTQIDSSDVVPLERKHLADVLDPLSAIMALTHTDAASPCGRKVAIFDGRQRFNIDLRFARKVQLTGTSETAVVCRVKYTPIAGYRPNEETRQLAASNAIEIVFRPVPTAKLMLPQSVSVPTPAGTARIDLVRVNIELPERGRVASID